jgi:hypothetical protein
VQGLEDMGKDERLERRQMLRLSDRVLFSCSKVTPEKYEALASDFAKGIPPYNQEELQDVRLHISAQSALSRLRNRDEDLAEFLHHLDNKLNLLLKEVRKAKSPLDHLIPHKISLSSGGMAYLAKQPLAKDDHLELHLVLLPSYTYIYCLGTVVNCQPTGDNEMRHRLSIRFTLLMEEDHEKIIQHLFKLQSLALRNRRLQS